MSMLQWKFDGVKKPLWKEVSQESGDLKALWSLRTSLEVRDGLFCWHFVPEMSVKEQENPSRCHLPGSCSKGDPPKYS